MTKAISNALMPRNGIKVSETDAMHAYLQSVNGRATSHTATPFLVGRAAIHAEEALDDKDVAKTRRIGTVAKIETPPPSARSYSYTATVSSFEIKRFAEGWRLMSAEKVSRRPATHTPMRLLIDLEEYRKIQRKAVAGFSPLLSTTIRTKSIAA